MLVLFEIWVYVEAAVEALRNLKTLSALAKGDFLKLGKMQRIIGFACKFWQMAILALYS